MADQGKVKSLSLLGIVQLRTLPGADVAERRHRPLSLVGSIEDGCRRGSRPRCGQVSCGQMPELNVYTLPA